MRKVISILIGIVLLILLSACGRGGEPEVIIEPTPVVLSQWAVEAEASTQYGQPDWSALRATGAPDVEGCVDDPRAWASARGNGLEWLQLHYAESVYATEVRIYQTLGRGSIARVILIDENGESQTVWEGTDAAEPCPGILSVPVVRTATRITEVRVELDESRTGFWNQIDAVELIGLQ